MKRRTIISMEQALSLTYATLRFAQLGWRVIRLEATPGASGLAGDPNRYIGDTIVDDDRRSYFIAPNVGKEAIALNLKTQRGRDLLQTLIRELDVDVFCCNTLPSRYESLGIDYDTLRTAKPDLIWAGISAMGPEYPDVPGYDPAIQAMAGYMELTGELSGPPMLSGIPITDLKAGDEVYAGICLALADRAETGRGRAIHVSMLQAAASWLITTLPLLDFDCDPSEITRCGNEHRKFIPVNVYAANDGFILIAIGNDGQWERLTRLPVFQSLHDEARRTNDGRHTHRENIHRDMSRVVSGCSMNELRTILAGAGIPHAPIQTIPEVRATKAVASQMTTTRLPDGKVVHLQPPAVTYEESVTELDFPPRYNQHTAAVLNEAGLTDSLIAELAGDGVIPE